MPKAIEPTRNAAIGPESGVGHEIVTHDQVAAGAYEPGALAEKRRGGRRVHERLDGKCEVSLLQLRWQIAEVGVNGAHGRGEAACLDPVPRQVRLDAADGDARAANGH